jgi:hypothetical protein
MTSRNKGARLHEAFLALSLGLGAASSTCDKFVFLLCCCTMRPIQLVLRTVSSGTGLGGDSSNLNIVLGAFRHMSQKVVYEVKCAKHQ